MNAARASLIVAWLACAAGFVIAPSSTLATAARYAFWLMLVAHVGEFAFFFSRLRKSPGSLATHFVSTLLFGFLHIRDLPPQTEEIDG